MLPLQPHFPLVMHWELAKYPILVSNCNSPILKPGKQRLLFENKHAYNDAHTHTYTHTPGSRSEALPASLISQPKGRVERRSWRWPRVCKRHALSALKRSERRCCTTCWQGETWLSMLRVFVLLLAEQVMYWNDMCCNSIRSCCTTYLLTRWALVVWMEMSGMLTTNLKVNW